MPREARDEGLSRRHRFRTQGSYGAILRSARKIRGDHAILHVAPARGGVSRLGIAIARRVLPSAVDRNRARRLVREAFRRHAVKRAGLDLVIAFRAPFDTRAAALRDEIRFLLDRAAELSR
jgi:ribonuclease P protein component